MCIGGKFLNLSNLQHGVSQLSVSLMIKCISKNAHMFVKFLNRGNFDDR